MLFGSVQDFPHDLRGQVLDGGFEGVSGSIQERLNDLHGAVALDVAQRRDAPLLNTFAVIGDNQRQFRFCHPAEAVTLRTGSVWRVERKQVRFGIGVGIAGGGAHQMPAKMAHGVFIMHGDAHVAFAQVQGGLNGAQEALFVIEANCKAVDDHFDVVYLVAVEAHTRFELDQNAVDSGTHIALLHDRLEQFAVVAFPTFHQGSEQEDALAVIILEHPVQDFLIRETDHGFTGLQAEGIRCSGVNQPQEVMHFCDGADGRTRVFGNGLLLDADDRAQSSDLIHFGTFQSSEELPGIG